MITKIFGKDFHSDGGALTLDISVVVSYDNYLKGVEYTKEHTNGWTITAKVYEDYCVWVNEFYATHPKYGKVYGDFEEKVYADSEEGFFDFYQNFPPGAWDYADI